MIHLDELDWVVYRTSQDRQTRGARFFKFSYMNSSLLFRSTIIHLRKDITISIPWQFVLVQIERFTRIKSLKILQKAGIYAAKINSSWLWATTISLEMETKCTVRKPSSDSTLAEEAATVFTSKYFYLARTPLEASKSAITMEVNHPSVQKEATLYMIRQTIGLTIVQHAQVM